MAIQLHPVPEDSQCPFCGARVTAGLDTCPLCSAQHGTMPRTGALDGLRLVLATIGAFAGLAGFVVLYMAEGDTTSICLGAALLVWLAWSVRCIYSQWQETERTEIQWWPAEK